MNVLNRIKCKCLFRIENSKKSTQKIKCRCYVLNKRDFMCYIDDKRKTIVVKFML